jgi:hypothetical protein
MRPPSHLSPAWVIVLTLALCVVAPHAIAYFRAYWAFLLIQTLRIVDPTSRAAFALTVIPVSVIGLSIPIAGLCLPFGWFVRKRPALLGAIVGITTSLTFLYWVYGYTPPQEYSSTWPKASRSDFLIVTQVIESFTIVVVCTLATVLGARSAPQKTA